MVHVQRGDMIRRNSEFSLDTMSRRGEALAEGDLVERRRATRKNSRRLADVAKVVSVNYDGSNITYDLLYGEKDPQRSIELDELDDELFTNSAGEEKHGDDFGGWDEYYQQWKEEVRKHGRAVTWMEMFRGWWNDN